MIKLTKTAKPNILLQNAQKWTEEYLTCLQNHQVPSDTIINRYKHPDIKAALEAETHGKCAYCESKIMHVEYGDSEHILPKNKDARPDLYVEWDNLTLACTLCNRDGKKAYYDPNAPLVNPYTDNIDDYFNFVGYIIHPKNKKGTLTIDTIKLNRLALAERRKSLLEKISKIFDIWNALPNSDKVKNVLHTMLKDYCNIDSEYSAFVIHFLSQKGFV